MSYQTIEFSVEENIAIIRLNRPKAANSINMDMARELMLAAIECDENPEIRCVLLSANGPFFSAGGDVASFAEMGENIGKGLKELTSYLHSALARFARMGAPLVTAINGKAAGAGLSLACLGDIAIAAEPVTFTMAYTGVGLTPDGGATYNLPRLIGDRRAKELMLTNRPLTAEEAVNWGMINQVVAEDELMDTAMASAKKLAKGPTGAYREVKELLHASANNGFEAQMELEARAIARQGNSAEGQEGITAFLNKRKADFVNA
ncbi:enoyl-CoA hydratase [Gammaproteobacteria bacterium 45_16_T64]|nr:enoyl-CoA hydratase [Gammaproteobacteria bacterium 45_16_T64]